MIATAAAFVHCRKRYRVCVSGVHTWQASLVMLVGALVPVEGNQLFRVVCRLRTLVLSVSGIDVLIYGTVFFNTGVAPSGCDVFLLVCPFVSYGTYSRLNQDQGGQTYRLNHPEDDNRPGKTKSRRSLSYVVEFCLYVFIQLLCVRLLI